MRRWHPVLDLCQIAEYESGRGKPGNAHCQQLRLELLEDLWTPAHFSGVISLAECIGNFATFDSGKSNRIAGALAGSGANMCEGAQQGQWRSKDYAASTAFQIAGTVWFLIRRLPRANCPLRIRWSSSIPAMVVAAQSKFLKPSVGPVRDLVTR